MFSASKCVICEDEIEYENGLITCDNCGYYSEYSDRITEEQLQKNIEENEFYCLTRKVVAKVSDVHRQGRSAATRERVRLVNEYWSNRKLYTPDGNYCEKCFCDHIILDERKGSIYCDNCGFEKDDQATYYKTMNNGEDKEGNKELLIYGSLRNESDVYLSTSKRYERDVHYSQKISSAYGKDPRIKFSDIKKINDYLHDKRNVKTAGKIPFLIGPQAIKQAVYDLKLPVVYASRWVQIRQRMLINDVEKDECTIPYDYLPILKLRFNRISIAFQHTLGTMNMQNMISLSYLIPCLIRIDSEEMFRQNARFFSMQPSQSQPMTNNTRWRFLINYCKKHFSGKVYLKNGKSFNLEWRYIPLRTSDILDYFKVLR